MQQGKPGTPIVYYVFDVLEVDGEPLIDLPLTERRERLAAAPRPAQPQSCASPRPSTTARRSSRRPRSRASRGSIAKRADSRYRPGKRGARVAEDQARHGAPGVRDRRLHEGPGPAGGPLRLARARRLARRRAALRRQRRHRVHGRGDRRAARASCARSSATEPPFPEVPKMPKVRRADVVWVEPELVAEVEFVEWTHDGRLRAPSFQGLREDKPAREVHQEEPLPAEIRKGKPPAQAVQPRQALLARRTGSRRATCSPTTARSRRCSCRT